MSYVSYDWMPVFNNLLEHDTKHVMVQELGYEHGQKFNQVRNGFQKDWSFLHPIPSFSLTAIF